MQHVKKYCHEKCTKKYHKKHFTNKILRYMSSCFEASQSMPPPVTRLNLCCTVYLTLWKWDSERVGEEDREWRIKKETPEAGGLTRSICFCFCLAQGQLGAVAKCQQTFECRLSLTCPPSCLATRLSLSCSLFLFPFRPSGVSLERNYVTGSVAVCVKAPKSQFGSLHTEGSWKHVLG